MYKSLTGEFEDVRKKREPGTLKGHTRYDYHISVEKAHGREEKRETLVYSNGVLDKMYKEWKDIRTIVETSSERLLLKKGKVQKEKRYYITSLEMNAENIHELVRAHWKIENNLHWQMDVAFGEDRDRKTKNAARNFSLICKMALTLLQRDKKKVSIKTKRKIAGWAQEYLEQVIMQKNI